MTKVTYIEDLKAGDVQHSYEVLARQGGVQGAVDAHHQPLEHSVVRGFGQSADGIVHLQQPHAHAHTRDTSVIRMDGLCCLVTACEREYLDEVSALTPLEFKEPGPLSRCDYHGARDGGAL